MKTKGYFIERDGKRSGPYSRKELSEFWEQGVLAPEDDVFVVSSGTLHKAKSMEYSFLATKEHKARRQQRRNTQIKVEERREKRLVWKKAFVFYSICTLVAAPVCGIVGVLMFSKSFALCETAIAIFAFVAFLLCVEKGFILSIIVGIIAFSAGLKYLNWRFPAEAKAEKVRDAASSEYTHTQSSDDNEQSYEIEPAFTNSSDGYDWKRASLTYRRKYCNLIAARLQTIQPSITGDFLYDGLSGFYDTNEDPRQLKIKIAQIIAMTAALKDVPLQENGH
jgi:hypothetical protein